MQARSLIVLAVGVVIALGTAWSLSKRMSSSEEKQMTQVMVASNDIPAGSFVRSATHLMFKDWPQDSITESMLTSDKVKLTDFDGAVARRAITKGETLTKAMMVKSNEGGFMSAVLEPGKRAVSIEVNQTSGNAGFIFPGDRVDLILTNQIGDRSAPVRASQTFIEDVRVLAVDQMLDNPENKAVLAKTVTLEVTPKQAEEINVAKDLGKISLSLRSLAASPEAPLLDGETAPTDLDAVLEQGNFAPQPKYTRDTDVSHIIAPGGLPATRVRVIRGNQQEDIDFSIGGGSNNNSGGGGGVVE